MNDKLEDVKAEDSAIIKQLDAEFNEKYTKLIVEINRMLNDVPGLEEDDWTKMHMTDETDLRAERRFCQIWESIKAMAYGSGERIMCERAGLTARTVNSVTTLNIKGFELLKTWGEKHLKPYHGFNQAFNHRSSADEFAKSIVANLRGLSTLVEKLPIIVAYYEELRGNRADRIQSTFNYARGVLDALKAIK